MLPILEIDFALIKDKAEDKVFTFTNADGSVYDMTDSTAVCKLYKDPDNPISINCTITVLTGKITIPFTTSHSDTLGTFEYILEETRTGGAVIPLLKGNIIVERYTPFSESITAWLKSELPANLTLTVNFQNQRLFYWRKILQNAFEIIDADLNKESAWPDMVNALFAKLIVYDALELALKGSFAAFLGGDYTTTTTISLGDIKSVETGPTKVEYFGMASSVKEALSKTQGGLSMFELIKQSLCGLARYLGVQLSMCDQLKTVIVPKYYENPNWVGTEITDL